MKVNVNNNGQDEASPLEVEPASSSSGGEQREGGETESSMLYMYNEGKFLHIL